MPELIKIYFPVLPSLRLITSSAYLIPLPLYTSGGLFVLITAAVWPTSSLSIPFTIIVRGIDKEKVGQIAAEIRTKRPPEVYRGKGIKYADEVIRRKVGKTGKK